MQLWGPHRRFSWFEVIILGVPFGAVMTWLTIRQFSKLETKIGLTTSEQRQAYTALKTGKLPTDPQILAGMPAYLDHFKVMNEKVRKSTIPFAIIFSGAYLLFNFGGIVTSAITATLFFAFMLVGYIHAQQILPKVASFYDQLGVKSGTDIRQRANANNVVREVAQELFRFGSSYWGLLVAFVGILLCIAQPELTTVLGVSLLFLGLVLAIPYHLLAPRWAKLYAALLIIATGQAVYRLYEPIGSHRLAPTHVPLPHGIHSLAGYLPWLIFHSTPILILICLVTTFDIMNGGLPARERGKGAWKRFALFIAYAAFFMGSLLPGKPSAPKQPANTLPPAIQNSPNAPQPTSTPHVGPLTSFTDIPPADEDPSVTTDADPILLQDTNSHFDGAVTDLRVVNQ